MMIDRLPSIRALRPLSAHAKAELRDIASSPAPICSVNPGVSHRLLRGGLVEVVSLKSPYPTHKGREIGHLRITADGQLVVDALEVGGHV